MPNMLRNPKSKAAKIAYKIMGIPDNMKFQRSKEQEKWNRKLLFEESSRVR